MINFIHVFSVNLVCARPFKNKYAHTSPARRTFIHLQISTQENCFCHTLTHSSPLQPAWCHYATCINYSEGDASGIIYVK